MLPSQGAGPVIKDGELLGTIGGQDEDCAQVGLLHGKSFRKGSRTGYVSTKLRQYTLDSQNSPHCF